MTDNKQIKSKKRVTDHGEVYTPEWLVKDMLNLIPKDATKIQSRYLENSAGEGAFLVEIAFRKLKLVFQTYHLLHDREFYTLVAISNIYGLELLKDNVEIIKIKMKTLVIKFFNENGILEINSRFIKSLNLILDANIIHVNSLNYKIPLVNIRNEIMKSKDGTILYSSKDALISEWNIDYKKRMIQRTEYFYKDIVMEQQYRYKIKENAKIMGLDTAEQLSFFSEENEFKQLDMFEIEDVETYVEEAKPVRITEARKYNDLI